LLRLLRQISYRQLRTSWGRTVLVVSGIATGVALIVAINIINASVLASFQRQIELIAGPAALEVVLGVGEVGFPEATIEGVRADPEVVTAVPLVRGTVALADDPTDTLQLFGADFTAEKDLQRYRIPARTDRRTLLRAMEDPTSILVTDTFAATHGLEVGDALAFTVPDGIKRLTVRGLLAPEGMAAAFGGRLLVMDLPAAQLLLRKEGRIDQIDIVLRPDADVEVVRDRLASTLPDVLHVTRPLQRGEQYEGVLASFQAMLTGFSALCLVAGVFIIFNTTSTAAIQRAGALGRMRLIGAEPDRLFRLLMLEALLLGLVGSVWGIVVGVPLAWALAGTITDSMGVIFQLHFSIEQLVLRPLDHLAMAALGVGVTLFASFFAARKLAAVDPLEVLRGPISEYAVAPRTKVLIGWWILLLTLSSIAFVIEDRSKSIAWGNFGSTLWNASVIVIAIPIVQWMSGILSRTLPRWFGPAGRVAAESLRRATNRTGVTVAAIALIMTIAIMLSSLVLSCRESLRSYFAGVLAADVAVSAVSTEGGWLETPLPEDIARQIEAVPGVQGVAGGRVLSGQPFRGHRIGVLALDALAFDAERAPPGWYREGDPVEASPRLAAGEAVSVSVSLSDRFDVHVGDTIELASPTGVVALPVVGVVPDYVSDRGSVILSRTIVTERWHDHLVNRFHAFLEPGASLETVRAAIKERLGSRYRLKILSLSELLDYHTDLIDRAFSVMNTVQLLIIIVTIAGIFDLLLARIIERRHELALWRVIGADDASVRRSVAVESVTIGAMGAVLGIVVGMVTAWIWIGVHFRHLLGYYVEYHFALAATVWYTVLVILMTAAAGIAAARHATRQSVLQTIQTE
jgi:putative ABC transport system permease protein